MIEVTCKNNPEKRCSDFFMKGKTKSGTQRYRCRQCGYVTVEERFKKERYVPYMRCADKECNSKKIVYNGTYGTDIKYQRYLCKDCKHSFSYER